MITVAVAVGAAGVLLLLAAAVLRRRRATAAPFRPVDPETLRAEIAQELARSGGVAAIKRYRQRTGASLAEAKEAVDRISRGPGDHRPT
ncbi:hypothetical protein AB0C07_07890 [Actinoplanes missouriensis]|uniref:hypothetical protein n=1 Tax=Actinoplanes missouriensis TaxID=1866 RepID=UPI0033DD9E37